jgi:hypothetical protein
MNIAKEKLKLWKSCRKKWVKNVVCDKPPHASSQNKNHFNVFTNSVIHKFITSTSRQHLSPPAHKTGRLGGWSHQFTPRSGLWTGEPQRPGLLSRGPTWAPSTWCGILTASYSVECQAWVFPATRRKLPGLSCVSLESQAASLLQPGLRGGDLDPIS